MQVHFGSDLLTPEWTASVVCIGTFDGVHRGHREVIEQAVRSARAAELPAILVTFDRHPASVLAPDRKPPPIATVSQNLRQFETLGIAISLVCPFTVELSQTSAADFLEETILKRLHAHHVVVGHDFAFGRGREGTHEWLQNRIETTVVAPVLENQTRISSTAIREAIQSGDFEVANLLLGREWALDGIVVSGQKLGRKLGYPTINLARASDQIVPLNGIYGGICETRIGRFKAAISIGTRPTVSGEYRTIEAYLLDYPGDSLYGEAVELCFSMRLRNELKFDSLDTLCEQMALDVKEVADRIAF